MPAKLLHAALGFALTPTVWACVAADEPSFDAELLDAGELVADGGPVDAQISCLTRVVRPDPDGDGHYVPGYDHRNRQVCIDEPVPPGFVAVETAAQGDCDDHDPLRWQSYCVDLDGDGAKAAGCAGSVLPESTQSCPSVSTWRLEPDPFDCDDNDPTRSQVLYRDADGDGNGTGPATCIAEAAGWSIWAGDCDDGDAARRPGQIEWFGDGKDSDCNGDDEGRCGPAFLGSLTWAPPRACDGTNLALGFVSCAGCVSPSATLAVENRGATMVSADVLLVGSSLPQPPPPVFHLQLLPGESKLLLSGAFTDAVELRLAAPGAADCDPEDNGILIASGHCN